MTKNNGFAIWITGLPASGKSTITKKLVQKLNGLGVQVVVLESDEMRKILTPEPTYSPGERKTFYRQLVQIGELLTRQGVNVIFDATANMKAFRDHGRERIPRFSEIYVTCPVEVCVRRDPKGIYARAAAERTSTVPGIHESYEPPMNPEAVVDGTAASEMNADKILGIIRKLHFI